jgi:methylation protein EvaC
MPVTSRCRICDGTVQEFFDFGRQPLSDAFVEPAKVGDVEFFFQLSIGICTSCSMVQLTEEVPRGYMFHEDYPYLSSGSSYMRKHFGELAERFRTTELTGDDPFIVELGCNDGVMLRALADAGIRHLGVEPSGGVADLAATKGITVRKDFFGEAVAADIRRQQGPADVVYAANTLCHIPYMGAILRGVASLLAPDGVFVFEDPYFADIVGCNSFDQIYDEHFFFFTARSVRTMAQIHGLELVDAERLPVHGGEVRYTLALAGARTPRPAVAELIAAEQELELTDVRTLEAFGANVHKIRDDLVTLLRELKEKGNRVVGYGATAKSATVLNLCGIGPDLIEFISDTSSTKQGRVTPGTHIPVKPPTDFAVNYPDYAVLFAWNHAEEIMAKEQGFRDAGGRWIQYVPGVRVT